METSQATPQMPLDTNALLPNEFDRNDFKTWQQKMFFYLTTLNFTKFLKEDKPRSPPRATDVHTISSIDDWVHSVFLCRGCILSRMVDTLYSIYNNEKEYPMAKHLWKSLERKYKSENVVFQRYEADVFRSKPKPKRQNQANLTEEDLCRVVTDQVNTIEGNSFECWYDTCATTHICIDKDIFNTYEICKSGGKVEMGNTKSSKTVGRGK